MFAQLGPLLRRVVALDVETPRFVVVGQLR